MDVWRSLPDELVIRVLLELMADPDPILTFAQTSRRHNQVASDDSIWIPIMVHFFHQFKGPARSVDAADLRRNKRRFAVSVGKAHPSPFRRLYITLIGPNRWMFGYWVSADRPTRTSLWTVYLRMSTDDSDDGPCHIVGQWALFEPNLMQPGPQLTPTPHINNVGSLMEVELVGNKVIVIAGTTEYVQKERPLLEQGDDFVIGADGSSKHNHITHFRHRQIPQSPWKDVHSVSFEGRLVSAEFADAPFPSPSALSAIRDVTWDSETKLPIVLAAEYDSHDDGWSPYHHFIPLKSPSSFPKHTTNLLAEGFYQNDSGNTLRIVYVRIRELTEAEFRVESDWPWEGSMRAAPERWDASQDPLDWSNPDVHLGPFSSTSCSPETGFPLRVAKHPIRPGHRIVEVTKMCGPGIPKGFRSVLAFLNDLLVPQDDLTRALADLPQSFRNPDTPTSEHPWPISPSLDPDLPPTIENMFQHPFRPVKGIDLPGVGRLCYATFAEPSWMDVILHAESRDRFSIFWQDIDMVEIYTKMDDI